MPCSCLTAEPSSPTTAQVVGLVVGPVVGLVVGLVAVVGLVVWIFCRKKSRAHQRQGKFMDDVIVCLIHFA